MKATTNQYTTMEKGLQLNTPYSSSNWSATHYIYIYYVHLVDQAQHYTKFSGALDHIYYLPFAPNN